MKKKIRPYGEILLDLEVLYQEAIRDHDVQLGDLLYNCFAWAKIHNEGVEEYEVDNSSPVLFYGHKNEAKKWAKKL